MRLLFIGDIVGKSGRQALAEILPRLRNELSPDFTVANGENAAGGMGITREIASCILSAGIDVITLGNHVWAKKEVYPYLDEEARVIRPANYPDGAPGRGWGLFPSRGGDTVGVVNLCGRVFMDHLECPFRSIDSILKEFQDRTRLVFVDFHAEATSEKSAFAWYVDGRVAAVIGTHTHVQTADEHILPSGTAYITDVGMTGPTDSVIGVRKDLIISRFITQMPNKFELAEGESILTAVVIDADPSTGRALSIERIQQPWPGQ